MIKLTLSTRDADFANAFHSATGVKLEMAQPYDAMDSMQLRTMPMDHETAWNLADYLRDAIEPGENIGNVDVIVSGDGSIAIDCSNLAGPIRNLQRFIDGAKPGLDIFEIARMSGVACSIGESTIVFEKPWHTPGTGLYGVERHVETAIISYLKAQDESPRGLMNISTDRGLTILPPKPSIPEIGIGGVYKAIHERLHRDRAIPPPSGPDLTSGMMIAGINTIGRNTAPTVDANGALQNITRSMISMGVSQENAKVCGKLAALEGYFRTLQMKYRDIPTQTMDEVCADSHLHSQYEIVKSVMPSLNDALSVQKDINPRHPCQRTASNALSSDIM